MVKAISASHKNNTPVPSGDLKALSVVWHMHSRITGFCPDISSDAGSHLESWRSSHNHRSKTSLGRYVTVDCQ